MYTMLGYGMVLCTTADADRVIKSGTVSFTCILYLLLLPLPLQRLTYLNIQTFTSTLLRTYLHTFKLLLLDIY
jgi:hypothetical protein